MAKSLYFWQTFSKKTNGNHALSFSFFVCLVCLTWVGLGSNFSRQKILLTLGQFHQPFTYAVFVQKPIAQLFPKYSLSLRLFGQRILAKKIKCKMLMKFTLLSQKMRQLEGEGEREMMKYMWKKYPL